MVAPGFALLRRVAGGIPPGASVVVRTEPSDATKDTWYHHLGVALLPGRVVLPAAVDGKPAAPETWRGADYVVVVGAKPARAPGTLVLETAEGGVWKADRR